MTDDREYVQIPLYKYEAMKKRLRDLSDAIKKKQTLSIKINEVSLPMYYFEGDDGRFCEINSDIVFLSDTNVGTVVQQMLAKKDEEIARLEKRLSEVKK
jgi:hypothetical protein